MLPRIRRQHPAETSGREIAAQGVGPERQGQAIGGLEPAPQVNDVVKAFLAIGELRLVNDQAGVDAA